jgi:hypothetical protein
MNKMRTLLLAGTALVLASAAPASAAVTASFCGPSTEGGTCEGPVEAKVFLDASKAGVLGTGEVGSPGSSTVIDFSSDTGLLNNLLDFSGGFATIKPQQGSSTFNGIDITIPGFTFTDIAFDVQLTPVSGQSTDSFTVSTFSGAHVSDGTGTLSDAADTDKQFSATAVGGAFDEVNIQSSTGFDEIKHIEISGLSPVVSAVVPEPQTWALMGLGFAGMALVGLRKRKDRLATFA